MTKNYPLLELHRAASLDMGTPGVITHKGERVCYVMELPDRDNKPDLSRINAGLYLVQYIEKSASGHFVDVYHITNVDGRQGILIHGGNWSGDIDLGFKTDSHGCVLTATRLGWLANQLAGLASRSALRKLHSVTGRKDFLLQII